METERAARISAAVGGQVGSLRHSALVTVAPDRVVEACKLVVEDGQYYHLSTITGIDEGENISVLYHFWKGGGFVTVKTSVPKSNPRLPSVSASLPAALFYEAEVMDMLGVVFEGNPRMGTKLLLPDAYPPEAPPPLRKEADPEKIRKMMGLE
ncbi:MAG TPA: NADH-quinone oxidoreductase subunit C [Nitrososphaerales archaeon]|nr:NADH-quinone oxidoreductase subunit C [Nitrososphaerales archaeon]HUK75691.1 NADH-quinone oxidoreductase subunit C [Nitrososphaerales archaeon]